MFTLFGKISGLPGSYFVSAPAVSGSKDRITKFTSFWSDSIFQNELSNRSLIHAQSPAGSDLITVDVVHFC